MRNWKAVVVAALLLVITMSTGCVTTAIPVRAVEGFTETILPEYQKYVEKDTNLSDVEKRIRQLNAESFLKLIEEAKKNEGK